MLRTIAFGLYGLAATLATPAAAEVPEDLATGAMSNLQVQAAAEPTASSFTRLDGSVGDLSDYAGKVVVLNFWATWCAPCRAEMPSLQALDTAYDGQDAEVVTVAFGRHNPVMMQRFWDDVNITSLPLYLDESTELARNLGVRGLPHTLILNREGQIVAQLAGEAHWDAPEAKAVVDALLAQ